MNAHRARHFREVSLSLALVALTCLLTGCPSNEYIVQLLPQGSAVERTLVFYCADGFDTNTGTPNYRSFPTNELAAIAKLYPAQSLTNSGGRYQTRGRFTNDLPSDVGGAGTYTNLEASLGTAGFYAERFRGNDDLAGTFEKSQKAADQMTDLIVGWSQDQLGKEPGYENLHNFLNGDFRRDLQNLGQYWLESRMITGYQTNAAEEFSVRFGLYLHERGYFTVAEIPALLQDPSTSNQPNIFHHIQRLVARKMRVPDDAPIPASLAFLADATTVENSFTNYLAGTEYFQGKLRAWQEAKKLKPDLKPPGLEDQLDDVWAGLIGFELFDQADHLVVKLSLPVAPTHCNGRWDSALKQVIWDTPIEERGKATQWPVACYASWAQPDGAFQMEHFGQVSLTGDQLMLYCLWRSSLDPESGRQWDTALATVQPGKHLFEELAALRLPGEPAPSGTNGGAPISVSFASGRDLLVKALH